MTANPPSNSVAMPVAKYLTNRPLECAKIGEKQGYFLLPHVYKLPLSRCWCWKAKQRDPSYRTWIEPDKFRELAGKIRLAESDA